MNGIVSNNGWDKCCDHIQQKDRVDVYLEDQIQTLSIAVCIFRWKFLHLALKQKAVYFLVTNSFLFCFCILRAFETYIFLSVSFGKQNKKGYCSQKEVSVVRCGNLHVVKKSFQTFIHTCLVSRPTEVTLWRKSATRTCLDTWQEHIFR